MLREKQEKCWVALTLKNNFRKPHNACTDFMSVLQDGYWVGVKSKSSALIYSTTVPGFLNCTRQGALPGCEIRYDSLEDQCAQGRQGQLIAMYRRLGNLEIS